MTEYDLQQRWNYNDSWKLRYLEKKPVPLSFGTLEILRRLPWNSTRGTYDTLCQICGGQSGIGMRLSLSILVSPCQCHFTSAPYSQFISYRHYSVQALTGSLNNPLKKPTILILSRIFFFKFMIYIIWLLVFAPMYFSFHMMINSR
jgi:hypothetical protein